MSDLISRQAVDDVIYDYSRSCDVNYAQIMEYIDKIPSVENKGEWIIYGFPSSEQIKNCTEDYYCSECKFVVSRFESRACNFCPNCGADMRAEETDYDYERAVDQLEHDILYEPTFNQDDGSM